MYDLGMLDSFPGLQQNRYNINNIIYVKKTLLSLTRFQMRLFLNENHGV